MAEVYRERVTIEYRDSIVEPLDDSGCGTRVVGIRKLRCDVEVVVEVARAARNMGPRACRSKGGKCVDGCVTVKQVGSPIEVSREMRNVE